MLVLTRKFGETVDLMCDGNKIASVVITGINGRKTGQVRMAFDAPKDVAILRREINDKLDIQGNVK